MAPPRLKALSAVFTTIFSRYRLSSRTAMLPVKLLDGEFRIRAAKAELAQPDGEMHGLVLE